MVNPLWKTARRSPGTLVGGALLACSLSACGGQASQTRVEGLERRLKVMDEAFTAQSSRIDALKNQVALLEDQLESVKLSRGAAGLPVVHLKPRAEASEPEPELEPQEEPVATIRQSDVDALAGGPSAPAPSGARRPVAPPPEAVNAGNIGVVPVAKAAAVRPEPFNDPIALFERARAAQAQGDLLGALQGYESFLSRHPRHDYADNALLAIGQVRFNRAEFSGALTAFRRVVTEYPGGNKAPDALLMIGLTQQKMGRAAEGRETLSRLMAMFPETEAAVRASAALKASAGRM